MTFPLHASLPWPCPHQGILPIHYSVAWYNTVGRSSTTWRKDLFTEEQLPLIMLYKKYILKHCLKPFSDCPATTKQCSVFPGMYCDHGTWLHLGLGDFYLPSFSLSIIFWWLFFYLFIIILMSPSRLQISWRWRLYFIMSVSCTA